MKNIKGIAKLMIAALMLVTVVSCSDGANTFPDRRDESEAAAIVPGIVKFEVSRVRADQLTPSQSVGDEVVEVRVEKGDSVKVVWNIINADTAVIALKIGTNVEITAEEAFGDADSVLHYPLDGRLSGEQVIGPINEPTTLVLYAVKKNVETEYVHRTAVITLGEIDNALDAMFTADPVSVDPGQTSTISWEVDDESAVVNVTCDNGEPITFGCEGVAIPADENGEAATITRGAFHAKGCAIIGPLTESTTCMLDATAAGKDAVHKELTVTVTNPADQLSANIYVDGQSSIEITAQREVEVSWTATPGTALVSIDISEPSAAKCEGELPQGTISSSGSIMCTVFGSVDFTITASIEGVSSVVSDVASVRLASPAFANLEVSKTWAFEGEQVMVTASVPTGTAEGIIEEVKIGGTPVQIVDGKASSMVTVPAEGVMVEMTYGGGKPWSTKAVTAFVLEQKNLSSGETGVASISYDVNDMRREFLGMKQAAYADGSVRLYDSGAAKTVKFPSLYNAAFMGRLGDYAVNAVSVRPDNAAQVFAATKGFVMYTNAEGKWERLTSYTIAASKKGENGFHNSCKGSTVGGISASAKGDPISMSQVCDVVALPNGKLVVAVDNGIRSLDIDGFIADWKTSSQKGAGSEYPTFGKIIHDLELVKGSDNKVCAATSEGVYCSPDGAADSFTKFGDLSETYTLTSRDGVLIAGTADGNIYYSAVANSAKWEKLGNIDSAVMSLAADPYSSVLLIAGKSSVSVMRDGNISVITSDDGEVMSVALSAKKLGTSEDSAIMYKVGIGKSTGAMTGTTVIEASGKMMEAEADTASSINDGDAVPVEDENAEEDSEVAPEENASETSVVSSLEDAASQF
ncbi:MAG: hypothetical protein COV43_08455 [Deltaproteobacteria bacterium CG11_big_fil_rev_8_21_14_0_20_42_23]|nr:MAG: hypothetical protein COV43_08455 [Deltaproteobacteria bacterium CG11_big_fil_rev_8_21_14_0_20_42_23]